MAARMRLLALMAIIVVGGAHAAHAAPATPATPEVCPVATPTVAPSPVATPSPAAASRIQLDHGEALLWGAGEHGVVLAHGAVYDAASWTPQAAAMAARGMVVLAVEELSEAAVLDGVRLLRERCGVRTITLIGASAGAGSVLAAAANSPDEIDQLILLSGTGDVSQLDDDPKLFIASEGEGMADSVLELADDAPGDQNEALIVPGDAHAQAIFTTAAGDDLLAAIIDWLERTKAEGGKRKTVRAGRLSELVAVGRQVRVQSTRANTEVCPCNRFRTRNAFRLPPRVDRCPASGLHSRRRTRQKSVFAGRLRQRLDCPRESAVPEGFEPPTVHCECETDP